MFFSLLLDFHQLCKHLDCAFPDAAMLKHANYPHITVNITDTEPGELCLGTISSYFSESVAFTQWCAVDCGEKQSKGSKPNTHQFYKGPHELSPVVKCIVHVN